MKTFFFIVFLTLLTFTQSLFGQTSLSIKHFDVDSNNTFSGSIISYDTNGRLLPFNTSDVFFIVNGDTISSPFINCSDALHRSVSIGLSLDVSGSTTWSYDSIMVRILELNLAQKFLNSLNFDSVEMAYHTFDDKLLSFVSMTKNRISLQNGIDTTPDYGFNNNFEEQITNYPDGILHLTSLGSGYKKVAILITDGVWGFINSWAINSAIQTCRDKNISFYVVVLTARKTSYSFTNSIKQIVDSTGGKIYHDIISQEGVTKALALMNSDIFGFDGCTFSFKIKESCNDLVKVKISSPTLNFSFDTTFQNKNFLPQSKTISLVYDKSITIAPCDSFDTKIILSYKDTCNRPIDIDTIIFYGDTIVMKGFFLGSGKTFPISKTLMSIPDDSSIQIISSYGTKVFATTNFISDISLSNKYEINGITNAKKVVLLASAPYCITDSAKITVDFLGCSEQSISLLSKESSLLSDTLHGQIISYMYEGKEGIDTSIFSYEIKDLYGNKDTILIEMITSGYEVNADSIITSNDSTFFYTSECDSIAGLLPIVNRSCIDKVVFIGNDTITIGSYSHYNLPIKKNNLDFGVHTDSVTISWISNGTKFEKSSYIITMVFDSTLSIPVVTFLPFQDSITKCYSIKSTVILSNNQCDTITIDSVYFDNAKFTVQRNSNIVLPAGASDTIEIVFDPSGSQLDEFGTITIETKDDTIKNQYFIVVKDVDIINANLTTEYIDSNYSVSYISFSDTVDVIDCIIRLTRTNPNYIFKSLYYEYGTIIESIEFTDSTLDIQFRFKEWKKILPNQKFISVTGEFILGIDTINTVVPELFSLNYDIPDFEECVQKVLAPNPSQVYYRDSCGTRMLRDLLRHTAGKALIIPNPATSEFIVKFEKEADLSIFNIAGRNFYNGRTNTIISTSNFKSGTYYVFIKDGKYTVIAKLIINE